MLSLEIFSELVPEKKLIYRAVGILPPCIGSRLTLTHNGTNTAISRGDNGDQVSECLDQAIPETYTSSYTT